MDDITNKRLLLAKKFYHSGMDFVNNGDSLSKIMAVHNFHIAIEITLKAVLFKKNIKIDKIRQIGLIQLFNEINKSEETTNQLPYKDEITKLNDNRNLAQHHSQFPNDETLDELKVVSRLFLEKVFDSFFNIELNDLTEISLISDSNLQKLLKKAMICISEGKFEDASSFCTVAFEYASSSIICRPAFKLFSSGISPSITGVIEKVYDKIIENENLTYILATGIKLKDYREYKKTTPFIHNPLHSKPIFESKMGQTFNKERSKWLLDFVVDSIVKWQQLGVDPKVPENLLNGLMHFLKEKNIYT